MGLDMMLYRKRYVKNWGLDENRFEVILKKNGEEVPLENTVYILENIMYWRKANAIHNYFVHECGGCEDDCRPIYISTENLRELKRRIDTILDTVTLTPGKVIVSYTFKNKKRVNNYEDGEVISRESDLELCRKLLPTFSGFFFGNTEYDEGYIGSLKDTQEMLADLMANPSWDNGDYDYEYRASW